MKGKTLQVRGLAGMQSSLPQNPEAATLIENWTVDRDTQALSSRVGYEKYRPGVPSQFAPCLF